jgi:hypothetical protein
MIVSIFGPHCSGKTEIVKRIISRDRNSFEYKKYKSVKFMVSKKFKLIVLGHYPEEGIYIGGDQVSRHSIPQVLEFFHKIARTRQEYGVLLEGTSLNSPEIRDFLKRKRLAHRNYYLTCSEDTFYFREKTLLEEISPNKKLKIFRACIELLENSNPEILKNDDERDIAKNVNIILGELNIRAKTKVR